MSQNSKIEWTHASWNPITGCSKISSGCKNCYAERMARRLRGRYGYDKDQPFKIIYHEDKYNDPYHWKKPRMIFVCSMGDLFHEQIPFEEIDTIFRIMDDNPRHIFQILTKRSGRLVEWFAFSGRQQLGDHIWIGVSCETQYDAEIRIPYLNFIQAKIKFVSFEPLLTNVYSECQKSKRELINYIDWIIVGGETGPRARKMELGWVESLQKQAHKYNKPFFFKQTGDWYYQNKHDINAIGKIYQFDRKFPLEIENTMLY